MNFNERFYPVSNEKTLEIYNKYKEFAKGFKNLYFLGRLGDYKYYDMDKALGRAFEVFGSIVSGSKVCINL